MERIKKYESLLGKWKVKRKLGEDDLSAVYEVESEQFGYISKNAVKLITFKNEEISEGMKEAVILTKLQGREHILTMYDVFQFQKEDTTNIVVRMELLTSLEEYTKNRSVDSNFVVKMGIDLCKALEICESQKILHQDINPSNIFINKDGRFKLGGFYLAREADSYLLNDEEFESAYMPPEMFKKGMKIDKTVDIYSLGMVMYQLLNGGELPLMCRNQIVVQDAMGERIFAPEDRYERVWEVIEKACHFEKEQRYQSAMEMRKELEKIEIEEKINLKNIHDIEAIKSDIRWMKRNIQYLKNIKQDIEEGRKHF